MLYINYIFVTNRASAKISRLRETSLRSYVYFFFVYFSREDEVKRTEKERWRESECRMVRKCSRHILNRIESSVCYFVSIFLSVCQSGIRHRATISRQTIRLSRESTTHPPPLTSIVFLLLCTVFLAYPFCQRVRKYNASDRINRSLSCRVHCYQNGETDFFAIFAECAKNVKL